MVISPNRASRAASAALTGVYAHVRSYPGLDGVSCVDAGPRGREPLPAFGLPPLRGEGQGDQRGDGGRTHLAPLSPWERGWG